MKRLIFRKSANWSRQRLRNSHTQNLKHDKYNNLPATCKQLQSSIPNQKLACRYVKPSTDFCAPPLYPVFIQKNHRVKPLILYLFAGTLSNANFEIHPIHLFQTDHCMRNQSFVKLLVMMLVAFVIQSKTVQAQSADEVFNKHLTAMGGD